MPLGPAVDKENQRYGFFRVTGRPDQHTTQVESVTSLMVEDFLRSEIHRREPGVAIRQSSGGSVVTGHRVDFARMRWRLADQGNALAIAREAHFGHDRCSNTSHDRAGHRVRLLIQTFDVDLAEASFLALIGNEHQGRSIPPDERRNVPFEFWEHVRQWATGDRAYHQATLGGVVGICSRNHGQLRTVGAEVERTELARVLKARANFTSLGIDDRNLP